MVKLSELKDNDMLIVGDDLVISKEDYLKEIEEHRGKMVYTTTKYMASLDAKNMLQDAIDYEAEDMFEDWDSDIWECVKEEDIRDLQVVLDRILARNSNRNISYSIDKRVLIDIG